MTPCKVRGTGLFFNRPGSWPHVGRVMGLVWCPNICGPEKRNGVLLVSLRGHPQQESHTTGIPHASFSKRLEPVLACLWHGGTRVTRDHLFLCGVH